MKKSFIFILFCLFSSFVFGQIKVLSPVEGVYANRQMLVIENEEGGEYYYSLNGSDPETFGFAYDGPVMIDLDGSIELKIAKAGRKKEEVSIKYTVLPDNAQKTTYYSFISSFYDKGIINYTAGTTLSIPKELKYSFGLPPDSFLPGQDVSISQKSILMRYIPCTLYDENTGKKWRFIVRTFPQSAGSYSRKDVPFVITDWNTLTFTNQNYLYKVDSAYWEIPKTSKKLDRSVSHMICWQSINYSENNPVEYFVLPPKPELVKTVDEDGALSLSIKGDDSYSICVLSKSESQYQELFKTIEIDTFYGDNLSGQLEIGFYTNSVYQGKMAVEYNIKKRPPAAPLINATSNAFYSRENVKVEISGEKGSELYYSVSEPFKIDSVFQTYTADSELFKQVVQPPYKKAAGDTVSINLSSNKDGAVYYKVSAYSKTDLNEGFVSEYSVIIDQYNYYYNAYADASISDGTSLRPFATFEQCLEALNKSQYSLLRLKGPLTVPSGVNTITANCSLINDSDASIEFEKDAVLAVKNAEVSLNELLIYGIETASKDSASENLHTYFKLDNASLNVNNCQISAIFDKNGVVIEGIRSNVNVTGTIASITAANYGSLVSSLRSNIDIQNSSVNVTADTAVSFSVNQGEVYINNNSFKVTGQLGRIAELFNVKGSVLSNNLKGDLKKKSNNKAVYTDQNCTVTLSKNEVYGF